MKKLIRISLCLCLMIGFFAPLSAQTLAGDDEVIKNIWTEAREHSQLKMLAHDLLDVIGPRLVGTPQMKKAHDWAVNRFKAWGIDARNEQWGTWRGWERGITHIDLLEPRVRSLEGMMMAWSPGTGGKGKKAGVISLPMVEDSLEFANWLPNVKGKFVLVSMLQPTGRTDDNWEEFGLEESVEKMKEERREAQQAWRQNLMKFGLGRNGLPKALEDAGAAGVIASRWSNGWGVQKIFGASTEKIPMVDLSLEDYGLVYRLHKNGNNPVVRITAEAKFEDEVPTFNTIAEIPGNELKDEYVILSAHYDSWDGGSGATDNGTGSLVMIESMRLLKKFYPNPKRTILVGLWGSEEQGLNGSRAFVQDNPQIVEKVQAVFNQDNGTGRVVRMSASGFLEAGQSLARWLARVPSEVSRHITLSLPGRPARGGSDYASFIAAGAPGFGLGSNSWDYGTYTWHTNRDTYDKVVFDELENNVILAASLVYLASEDPEFTSRKKSALPVNRRTGEPGVWPSPRDPNRKGGMRR